MRLRVRAKEYILSAGSGTRPITGAVRCAVNIRPPSCLLVAAAAAANGCRPRQPSCPDSQSPPSYHAGRVLPRCLPLERTCIDHLQRVVRCCARAAASVRGSPRKQRSSTQHSNTIVAGHKRARRHIAPRPSWSAPLRMCVWASGEIEARRLSDARGRRPKRNPKSMVAERGRPTPTPRPITRPPIQPNPFPAHSRARCRGRSGSCRRARRPP